MSPTIKTTVVLLVAWCLGFAAVNAWQLAAGRLSDDQFSGYTTARVVASILVLCLKLVAPAWHWRRVNPCTTEPSAGCWAQRYGGPPAP